ncbi:MAG: hypothetical protein D8H95_22080 [Lachnospiraceae bacterium]|nr:MAG: hypothetical protein D8H95_22080 [Lachnospiraceae bacterium]
MSCRSRRADTGIKKDWNYWKNSTKKINKQRVLEELSDCLHFFIKLFKFSRKILYR